MEKNLRLPSRYNSHARQARDRITRSDILSGLLLCSNSNSLVNPACPDLNREVDNLLSVSRIEGEEVMSHFSI